MKKGARIMMPLLKQENDAFILRLSKGLYRDEIIQKAVQEDREWVKADAGTASHFCLRLETSDEDDVLNWVNYLIYLHKG